jgi:hypothetical protein
MNVFNYPSVLDFLLYSIRELCLGIVQ